MIYHRCAGCETPDIRVGGCRERAVPETVEAGGPVMCPLEFPMRRILRAHISHANGRRAQWFGYELVGIPRRGVAIALPHRWYGMSVQETERRVPPPEPGPCRLRRFLLLASSRMCGVDGWLTLSWPIEAMALYPSRTDETRMRPENAWSRISARHPARPLDLPMW